MNFMKKASFVLIMVLLIGFIFQPIETEAATKITISNVKSVPDSLVKGKSVPLRGIIKSNSKITKVTGKIVNSSSKKTHFSKTVKPNKTSYSLAGPIDSALKFGKLPVGKYKYIVNVKTASGTSKDVISKTFQVVKTASTMSVSPKLSASSAVKGKGVAVYGYVKSNYNITKVQAAIVGTTYVKTVTLNAKSYNLAAVDSAMKFSKLNEGTYNLKVTAKDKSNTTKSKKVTCTITPAKTTVTVANSTLAVAPKVSPATAYAGTGIFVSGSVTSNYKITSVTGEIVGTSYKMTATPQTKTYSLSAMDSAMKFSKLSAGTYQLKVTAKDESGKTVTGYAKVVLKGVPGNAATGQAIADYACKYIGNPYVWAGTSLTEGADCSGFVMSVLANFGYSVLHSSYEQRKIGVEVASNISLTDLKNKPNEVLAKALPGDIVCYNGHVAIYCGNNTIVHAANPNVGIVKTTVAWTGKDVLTIRRVW